MGLPAPHPPHSLPRAPWPPGHVDQAFLLSVDSTWRPPLLPWPGAGAQSRPHQDSSPHTGGLPNGLRESPPMPPSRPGEPDWHYHPGSQVCPCPPVFLEGKGPIGVERSHGPPNMSLWPRTRDPLTLSLSLSPLSTSTPSPVSLGLDFMGSQLLLNTVFLLSLRRTNVTGTPRPGGPQRWGCEL